ncbi:erythromycin esterase family protein [Streptomyces sp. NPDC102467]|uniref:erythromycin esterase family protein n=1 Tax=Streptomyces sp. NPDC102467 TaxID=3366179 RepID=UPI00381D6A79
MNPHGTATPTAGHATLPDAELDRLAAALARGADVAGIGESTRFAHQTFDLRDRLTRRLIEQYGFRSLAVQDSADAAAAWDSYAGGGAGSAEAALDAAWRPWRTAETAGALRWIRAFNLRHPDDPVRIFGVKPRQAQPADYDAVLDHLRASVPDRWAEAASHLEPIRTAHTVDEHVQRARGLHPGRPFADHARDALALVETLPDRGGAAGERMRLIADFHRRSVAGRGNYAGEAGIWAESIIEHRRRIGHRIAYWDSIAHTAATPATLGLAPERGAQTTVGSVLREHFQAGYTSAAIGFHHGELGAVAVPEPDPSWIDAQITDPDRPAHWLDLRDDRQRRCRQGPATARVISGVYDPARDAAEHLAVDSLPDAFDLLIQVRRVTLVSTLAS